MFKFRTFLFCKSSITYLNHIVCFLGQQEQERGINMAEMAKVTRLRAIRAEKGIGMETLAEKAGVGRSSLFKYENGDRRITRAASIKICAALEIDTNTDLAEIVEVNKAWLHGNAYTLS